LRHSAATSSKCGGSSKIRAKGDALAASLGKYDCASVGGADQPVPWNLRVISFEAPRRERLLESWNVNAGVTKLLSDNSGVTGRRQPHYWALAA
jgi:hypothetical protein